MAFFACGFIRRIGPLLRESYLPVRTSSRRCFFCDDNKLPPVIGGKQEANVKSVPPEESLKRPVLRHEKAKLMPPILLKAARPSLTRKQAFYVQQMQYAKEAGNFPNDVFSVFEGMRRAKVPPATIHFNMVISAAAQLGDINAAFKYFDEMENSDVTPDGVTYNCLCNACAKSSDTPLALSRLRELCVEMREKRVELDLVGYNTLMSAYTNHGRVEEALAIENEMIAAGIRPNLITFNTIILALAKAGRLADAWRFYEQMPRAGVIPQAVTYNSLFDACAKSSDSATALTRARELRANMRKKRVKLDMIGYNTLMNVFAKHGEVNEVLAIKKEMIAAGIRPTVITFNVLISALGKADRLADAMELRKQVSTFSKSAPSPS